MSDLISREELLKQIETDSKGHEGQYGDEWLFIDTINSIPTAEPTIDDIAERISNTNWYHIFKGELRHGAHNREEALFKAEDIFNVLKDMGASDEYTDKRD